MSMTVTQASFVASIVEDAVVQLGILGGIKPDIAKQRQELSDIVGEEVSLIVEKQRHLEQRFESLLEKSSSDTQKPSDIKNDQREIDDITKELRQSTITLCRLLKANPSVAENLVKIQVERSSFEALISRTVKEIGNGHYRTLISTVNEEQMRQKVLRQTIQREKEATQQVKQLVANISNLKTSTETELETMLEKIQQMKDDKQALKNATMTEVNYLDREMEAKLETDRYTAREALEGLKAKKRIIKNHMKRESEVHEKTVSHLNKIQEEHEHLIQKWMSTYDEETESKANEVKITKDDRSDTIKELGKLQKAYIEMSAVVDEHNREQERLRLEEEERQRMEAATIVVQSYCRGYLTRKRLRNPPKKKKSGKKKK